MSNDRKGSLGSNAENAKTVSKDNGDMTKAPPVTTRQWVTVFVICFINLINYMDRYTIAGVLGDIQGTFNMSDSEAGLLQTAFIFVYMIMAPLFGYLGDRYTRKWLIAGGILFWSLATLAGSFMPNYGWFLAFRCLVGVGEASYTTNAPTIISDLFVGNTRSTMLILFNFAIPTGVGLGYMLGSIVTMIVGNGMTDDERVENEVWRWGLRVTPWLGFLAVILIVILLEEPPRGKSEGGHNLKTTSMTKDLKYLISNKAFVLDTLGFTFVTFVMGALAWWAPLFIGLAVDIQGETSNVSADLVPILFGVVSMAAGLTGVPIGSLIGQRLRGKYPKADALVCATGIILALPLFLITIYMAEYNSIGSLILAYFGQVCQNLNWSIVTDIMLYTVIPTRRSSASALLILVSHALGDAGSPYIMGVIAEAFKPLIKVDNPVTTTAMSTLSTIPAVSALPTTIDPITDGDYVQFKALLYSFTIVICLNVFGAVLFFWLSFHIVKAKTKVEVAIKETQAEGHRHGSISEENNLKLRIGSHHNNGCESTIGGLDNNGFEDDGAKDK